MDGDLGVGVAVVCLSGCMGVGVIVDQVIFGTSLYQLDLFQLLFVMFLLAAFHEAFELFDTNGGGTIDAGELDITLRSVGIVIGTDDLREIMLKIDTDGNDPFNEHKYKV